MPKILVIDDQPAVCVALTTLFELHGLEVRVAATPDEAIAATLGDELGAVVQDMNFRQSATSGEEGMDLLRRIKSIDPELPVVAMTAFTSIAGAVELIKAGGATAGRARVATASTRRRGERSSCECGAGGECLALHAALSALEAAREAIHRRLCVTERSLPYGRRTQVENSKSSTWVGSQVGL
ncbi:response regulator [Sorangium sp. So ce118]